MKDLPLGAHLIEGGRCHWRVWAPRSMHADVVLYDAAGQETASQRLSIRKYGYFEGETDGIAVGQRYAFRLDGHAPRPDPASRWQPDGVHRPSAVWRAEDWTWTDTAWKGIALKDLVLYELHVGTFTPEGTFAAVIPRLPALRELGVTAIELMPVGQFPGERGWGYDGTYWYAVQQSYGGPTELQRLVDACHHHGMGVVLDVVYNHLGPEGNYLSEFGPYFTERHHTPWGAALNFDAQACEPVRKFVLGNVRQWIRDFHIDGLRLDAVHAIVDDSQPHLLAEIKRVADEEARQSGRSVQIIAESNLNDVQLLDAPEDGGYGLDAQWSDDFHHSVHTLLTDEREGYYADFDTPAQQLAKALNEVFVYDGIFSKRRGKHHGAPVGNHSGERFVISIQTHDQVGNRALGDRFGTLLGWPQQRLATGLLLLAPHIPMFFMGEEYGESRPFPFFCDFGDAGLGDAVRRGRREEFAAFGWRGELPDPLSPATFESAILSWSWPEGSPQAGLRNLYQCLLQLRQSQSALQDFVHRHACLLPNAEQPDVLLLTRGDPAVPERCVQAMFNLHAHPVPRPKVEGFPVHELMSSDETRFGGPGESRAADNPLRPFEFVVLGHSR